MFELWVSPYPSSLSRSTGCSTIVGACNNQVSHLLREHKFRDQPQQHDREHVHVHLPNCERAHERAHGHGHGHGDCVHDHDGVRAHVHDYANVHGARDHPLPPCRTD